MKKTKKILIVLGAIFLTLIILAAIGIGIAAVKGSALDKETKTYVDATVPLVVSNWDDQVLWSKASPEFKQAVDKEKLDKLYVIFRKLGKFRNYEGSKGQSYMSMTSENGKSVTAVYLCKAIFDAGPAELKVTLVKHGDTWQIAGIHIDSDVFLQP